MSTFGETGRWKSDGWKLHEGSPDSETSLVWSIRTTCPEVGEPTMRMSRRTSGICDGISAARDQDTPSGVIGCRGHLATTFGRLQFAGAPMPYRVGSRWSSQRQEGRVFRFLPPFPSGEGSSTRGSSEFRVGRCERQLGTPSGVWGAIRRQRAFGRGVDGAQVDMGRGHQRRTSGGYIPWRGQTPREHRLSMDLNPPWRVSNAMVDESLEDGELASRPSTFGRFLLFSRGAGLPWEASGSAVAVLSPLTSVFRRWPPPEECDVEG
jgi:hypothetical protein